VRTNVTNDFLGHPIPTGVTVSDSPKPLSDLFERYAGPQAQRLYDEAVTELAHGLQSAALAESEGADDALIAAALLHDVGHLLVGDLFTIEEALEKDFKHEEVGARYLERWFGPAVSEPVRLHVAAKRYLVATEPGYFAELSPSSVRSLAVQGGAMSEAEQAAWRAQPGSEAASRLRRWDDLAKNTKARTRAFTDYHALLKRLADRA